MTSSKDWYEKNPEALKRHAKQWYANKKAKDPDFYRLKSAKYRAEMSDEQKEHRRRLERESAERRRRSKGMKPREPKLTLEEKNAKAREYYHRTKGNRTEQLKKFSLKQRCRIRGITVDEYNELSVFQGGVCAICQAPCETNNWLSIDHSHTTSENRGLLCFSCNTGLGHFKDDIKSLNAAIKYLFNPPARQLKRSKFRVVS